MKKIMVVDNEPDQIFAAKIVLENLDEELEIIGAGSSEQCLEMLNNGVKPDLIISETRMKGMSGRELSNKLKENHEWKNIPMMFLTAWEDKFEEDSKFSDDTSHIEKPFDMRYLKTRIDTVLKSQ